MTADPARAWRELHTPITIVAPDLRGGGLVAGCQGCQFVAAIVVLVGSVPLSPDPLRAVTGILGVKLLPEVLIHHRALVGRLPSVPLPTDDPLCDAVHDVLGIGGHFDFT